MGVSALVLLVSLLLATGVGIGLRRRFGLPLAIAGGGATILAIIGVFLLLLSQSNM
jgi:hypothetical protein